MGVNNHLNKHIIKTYSELFEYEGIIEMPKLILNAEDFYEFSMKGKIPVAMFWLNTKNEEIGFIYPNYSSKFDIYEKFLYIGSATLVGTALSFLKEYNMMISIDLVSIKLL